MEQKVCVSTLLMCYETACYLLGYIRLLETFFPVFSRETSVYAVCEDNQIKIDDK